MFIKEIFSEDEESILFLTKDPRFVHPHIIFDTLKDKEVEPDIKVLEDLETLKEISFILYAKPLSKKKTWAKRQKYILHLMPEEAPTEKDFKILNKLPANHYLEVDVANHKIRLIGSFVNEEGVSNWMVF